MTYFETFESVFENSRLCHSFFFSLYENAFNMNAKISTLWMKSNIRDKVCKYMSGDKLLSFRRKHNNCFGHRYSWSRSCWRWNSRCYSIHESILWIRRRHAVEWEKKLIVWCCDEWIVYYRSFFLWSFFFERVLTTNLCQFPTWKYLFVIVIFRNVCSIEENSDLPIQPI